MFRLLIAIFFIVIFLFFVLGAMGLGMLRRFFTGSIGRQNQGQQSSRQEEVKKKKIFDQSDGEYVEFEELEEDN